MPVLCSAAGKVEVAILSESYAEVLLEAFFASGVLEYRHLQGIPEAPYVHRDVRAQGYYMVL